MKASELMQGNIILYEYEGQKIPAKVIEIYHNSVLIESVSGEYEPIEIEEGKIFPVELISEILEKNGWIEASGYWVLKGYSTRLGWRNGEMVVGYAALPEEILYVHELQNLMKAVKISCNFEI